MSDVFDLETFLPYRLNRAAEMVSLKFASQYREKYQMTRPEWRALAALGSFGKLTATQIGQHSTMHKTKVSRAVRALEERRWLKRKADEDDRRVEHLELTATGTRHYQDLVAMARAYEETLVGMLGQQAMTQLSKGLDAIERSFPRVLT